MLAHCQLTHLAEIHTRSSWKESLMTRECLLDFPLLFQNRCFFSADSRISTGSSSRLLPPDAVDTSGCLWSLFGSGVIALLLDVTTKLLSKGWIKLDIEAFCLSEGEPLDARPSTSFIQLELDIFLFLFPSSSKLSFPRIPPSCLRIPLDGRIISLASDLRFSIFLLLSGTELLPPAREPLPGGDKDS